MATVTLTFTAGQNPGSTLRQLALAIQKAALPLPDTVSTGASTVVTIDNGPATGAASVQVTAGPYSTGAPLYIVG